MQTLMMAITPTQNFDTFSRKVIELARKEPDCWLFICYLIDESASGKLSESVLETGFVGERLTNQLAEAMETEYNERARNVIADIVTQAKEAGLETTALILRGVVQDELLQKITELKVDRLFLIDEPRHRFHQYLKSSWTKDIVNKATCPVALITEEGIMLNETK